MKLLYIHGYASSGSTGRTLKEIFSEDTVIAPSIPPKYDEAMKLINNIIETEKPDIIIGTSLGGYMTLKLNNPITKIAINPTFDPYTNLPEIDVPKEIYETYKGHSILKDTIRNHQIINNTYGMFGGSDPLFSYYNDFKENYLEDHAYYFPTMEHQIKREEIEKYLKPLVNEIMKGI